MYYYNQNSNAYIYYILLHYTISKNYPDLKYNFIFNNFKDNLWIIEHFILLKIDETTDEYQRLIK